MVFVKLTLNHPGLANNVKGLLPRDIECNTLDCAGDNLIEIFYPPSLKEHADASKLGREIKKNFSGINIRLIKAESV